ncbi:unnamed protein product [Mytilus coruscus]|uniref:Ig-like domain-containing protein n=1 Tax=Mytilus coruscus TaxID=42192 RepID=A0A6J8BZ47_MYTCO|nr:unnamed protein product [Mytilus coruscus]
MPDGISSFIVSPKKTETEVTPTSYIFRDSNKTSTRTNRNSSASFPVLPSYLKALTILESSIYIREGDILMLTCTGNIGKPPGKLLWQKISLQQNKSITYANITTYVEEIPGRCSFKGTSNLTVQISEDDLKVKFRCFEESQANVAGMYVETEPFDVHLNGAYAIPVFYQVVVVVLCFAVRKRYSKREKMNIYSEISDDQETISVDNEYEEIESVFYHEVNLHNGRIETSKQPISEEEIVLENIPISTSTSSSESNVTLSHLYVNTNIFNTNENRTMSANNETISNHKNGLGNCNIGVDNTFVSDNSGSDTLHVHQYVNMSSLRVPNVYEDLNHTNADTQKYESLN